MYLLHRLDTAIEQSEYLVAGLKNFNREQWPVRYPSLKPADTDHKDNSACRISPLHDTR